jgi:hypothetical protein
MSLKSQIIKNILIYFFLILGYLFLYVVDIEVLLNPEKEIEPQSKVNFIYQQF